MYVVRLGFWLLPMPKCRICKSKFERMRPLQPTCGAYHCAVTYAESVAAKAAAARAKKDRAAIKVRKEKAKRPQDLKAEARTAFHAYVRARDVAAGYGCIDCGKPFEPQKPGGSIDAGHYLSRGSAPHLAFDERNVHAQRKNCNRPGGATAAEYRAGLVTRIGIEAVEALESDQDDRRYRDDDYRRIRDLYRAKLKELKDKQ